MTIEEGMILDVRQAHEAPLGTKVQSSGMGPHPYSVKEIDGWHHSDRGSIYPPIYLQEYAGPPVVTRVGREIDSPTLEQYQQRWATMAIGQAAQSGIDRGPVHRAAETLGVSVYPERLWRGMAVHVRDTSLLSRIPEGALFTVGSPDDYATFRVVEWRNSDLRNVLGRPQRAIDGAVLTLYAARGVNAYPTRATEQDSAEIAAFKRRAWDIGVAAKGAHSWCSEFDRIMSRAGIAAFVADPPTLQPGEVWRSIDTDDTAHLWLGQRTGAVALTSGAPTIHSGMEFSVVRREGEALSIPVHSNDEMERMPEGTQISQPHPGDYQWFKGGDGQWRNVPGRTSRGIEGPSGDFYIGPLRYTHIPGVL